MFPSQPHTTAIKQSASAGGGSAHLPGPAQSPLGLSQKFPEVGQKQSSLSLQVVVQTALRAQSGSAQSGRPSQSLSILSSHTSAAGVQTADAVRMTACGVPSASKPMPTIVPGLLIP